MKKTFVTVMFFVALATAAQATRLEQDNLVGTAQTAVSNAEKTVSSEQDKYREYALQSDENEQHIVRYYDIERIVINNKTHATIRIYDDNWQLIEQTNQDVDRPVRTGNYYVTCSSKIKGSYVSY